MAGPALAQTAFQLDEVVFSANRFPTLRTATGSAITVVGREEIVAAGRFQLSDVLARQPGVTAVQQGPLGTLTQLRIRGNEPRYVATFIDGIRVDDPSLIRSEFDFGALGGTDIGRVEILRGSQSALWGGSAVAGVINIETLGALEDGITQTAEIEGGSFRTLGLRYGFGQRTERGEMALNLSFVRSDGFSAADENDGATEDDGFRARRVGFSLRHAISDAVTLGASGFAQASDGDYDQGFPIGDAPNTTRRREAGARVFAEFATGAGTQEVGISRYRVSRRFVTRPPDFPSDNTYVGERTRIDWLGSTELSAATTLVYGADWEREAYDQSGNFGAFDSSTRIAGAFVQALVVPLDGVNLQASARVDDHSRFGRFTSGRLAGAWMVADTVTLRGSVANGFRAPSNFELFSDFGDPTLEPERSRSLELGADLRLGAAGFGITVFDLRLSNAIDFAGSSYSNVPGQSRRRGVELTADLMVGDRWTLGGNYTFTDARDRAGERSWRVPRHDLALSAEVLLTDRLRHTTTLQALGGRLDNGGKPMPGFGVVNTRFAYALTDRAELTVRIDNLLDRQYQLVQGYGTSDRALYVGLSSRF
ncbi:TonB-dependent receptor plug domain-containing protein [Rhodobaculum claviforme]|nr:TonB-dependent receptor [Rhodobaculum claviforme]